MTPVLEESWAAEESAKAKKETPIRFSKSIFEKHFLWATGDSLIST